MDERVREMERVSGRVGETYLERVRQRKIGRVRERERGSERDGESEWESG